MPIKIDRLVRRRRMLGLSQYDLAIVAGVSPGGIQRLESGMAPDGGGKTGIDVLQRICMALQINIQDILIPPVGNRYQRSVQFAQAQHPEAAAPHLHERRRTVKADAYRKLTGLTAAVDIRDVPETTEEDIVVIDKETGMEFNFQRDPSKE